MYQSIPGLTIPRATPGDSHVPTAVGVGFSLNVLCPGSRAFDLKKFPTVSKEKCRKVQINWGQLEEQVFLYCFISIFAKTVNVCWIFDNRPISAILVILMKSQAIQGSFLLML